MAATCLDADGESMTTTVQRFPVVRTLLEKYAGAIVFVLALAAYLGVPRVQWSGDTIPASYLPISILEHGSLYLDQFPSLYSDRTIRDFPHGQAELPYYIEFRQGHYVSAFSPWPALLAVPVYAVPLLLGLPPSRKSVLLWAKLAASLITAFSVLFLFLALRELSPPAWAAGIAIVYALGTSAYSISSQALWEHGPSAMFLMCGLYLLVRGEKDESKLPYAGLCFSLAVMMRYTDGLIAAAVAIYILHKHRHILLWYLFFSVPPGILMLAYSHYFLGSALNTGYFQWGSSTAGRDWTAPFWTGFSGLLFSPARGLFVYSPILLFSLVGIWLVWKKGPPSFRYLSVGILFVILVCSKWYMWWGGWSYGPRLLADLAPLMCFFLYPLHGAMRKRPVLLVGCVLLAAFSIGMHAIGAYWDNGTWDARADVWKNPSALWSWKNSPFLYYGRYPYWDLGEVAHWLGLRRSIRGLLGIHHARARTASSAIGIGLAPLALRIEKKPTRHILPWCQIPKQSLWAEGEREDLCYCCNNPACGSDGALILQNRAGPGAGRFD